MDNIQKEENEEIIYFCFFKPKNKPYQYTYSLFSRYSFYSFGILINGYLYKTGRKRFLHLEEYHNECTFLPIRIKKFTDAEFLLIRKTLDSKYLFFFNNCISGWKWLFLRLGFKWNRMFNIPNVFYNYAKKKAYVGYRCKRK